MNENKKELLRVEGLKKTEAIKIPPNLFYVSICRGCGSCALCHRINLHIFTFDAGRIIM